MKTIELTQGKKTIVDDDDYELDESEEEDPIEEGY